MLTREENEALTQQVESLLSESDFEFIVIDGNGIQFGSVLHLESGPAVLFTLGGSRPFYLRINGTNFHASGILWFASTDCSGTPLGEPHLDVEIFARVVRVIPTGKTYIAPDAGTLSTALSVMDEGGFCNTTNATQIYGPLILIPELEEFAPPFRVITRGEFLTLQEEN